MISFVLSGPLYGNMLISNEKHIQKNKNGLVKNVLYEEQISIRISLRLIDFSTNFKTNLIKNLVHNRKENNYAFGHFTIYIVKLNISRAVA